jgi:phage/conjugal plasmid C-4 type zinc finger TraR family protein
MERFADELDQAQAHIENETEMRICSIQAQVRAGGGSPHCVACGGPIPEARRRLVPNAVRCIDCQSRHERGHG